MEVFGLSRFFISIPQAARRENGAPVPVDLFLADAVPGTSILIGKAP
jgi:hypothetical protein